MRVSILKSILFLGALWSACLSAESELLSLSLQELMHVNINQRNKSKLYFSKTNPPTKDSINIALIAPLSFEREQSVEVIAAARIAAKEINKKGGIGGKRLSVIVADDHFDRENLALLVKQMVDDYQIKAIIGPFTSKQSIDLFDVITKQLKLPMLLPAANANAITHLDDEDRVFRVTARNAQLADVITGFLEKRKIKKLGIFYQRDVFGNEITEHVEHTFSRSGGDILLKYPMSGFVNYQNFDLKNEIKRLKEQRVRAVFLPLIYNQSELVVSQLTKYWESNLPYIIFAEHASQKQSLKSVTKGRELCVFASVPYQHNKRPAILAGVEEVLNTQVATYTAAYVYDITYLLGAALSYQQKFGSALNSSIRKVSSLDGPVISANTWPVIVSANSSYRFVGQSGKINFDEHGDNRYVVNKVESFHQFYGDRCPES
ncbi:MAG: ABC transporter substrate-binding protein [Kangiellaceae bacterium]|nr:ABC transporter substrate-binding protein [Kangiellaceae bacterium]MCW9015711.1 ABC transporter substrate-binding protein [Kangiellaceae bacterium]